ncbi:MAG: DNA translocase FtsK [Chloroflexi bacterium OLB13]|nr:MAG: DNA translocase FtsK [Chloroflexi bacterium OLB13]
MATQSQPVLINRPPRIQPDLPQAEFEVPPPPELELGNITLIQSFLPLITIIGYVIVSATGSGRNLALIIPMGLSVVASSGLAFLDVHPRDA